jgi:sulfatase modifying factor 1
MREGAVKRGAAAGVLATPMLVAGLAACSEPSPAGGVLVTMDVEPALGREHLTELRVDVTSVDGGMTYRDAGYSIGDGSGPGEVRFPTSIGIDSNGDPKAAVSLDLSVWKGLQPAEVQRYRVVDIPTASVVALSVVFGSSCGASGPADGGSAPCPLQRWGCSWDPSQALWVCDAGKLPRLGVDGGAFAPATDSTSPDATTDQGSEAGAGDSTVGESGDAIQPAEAGGTSDAADASDAIPVDGAEAEAGEDAPLEVPCDAPCGTGRQCVQGACVSVPPSCSGGGPGAGPSCGGSGGTDDCCASDQVRSGVFFRDWDGVTYKDMSHPATVSQFRLDRYEVTVGRFRAFVDAVAGADASAWTPPSGSGTHAHLHGGMGLTSGGDASTTYETGWDSAWTAYLPRTTSDWDTVLGQCTTVCNTPVPSSTWTSMAGSNEKLPINCVSWYEAYAFCIWDGAFLPSVTEWDYAAAGGANQREFAWGNDAVNGTAYYAIYNDYYPGRAGGNICLGVGNIAPVGSAPPGAGVWGQLDLTGNVYEWTLDSAPAPYPLPCVDCAVTSGGVQRGLRGGGFDSNDGQLFNSFVTIITPDRNGGDVGVRCARRPSP